MICNFGQVRLGNIIYINLTNCFPFLFFSENFIQCLPDFFWIFCIFFQFICEIEFFGTSESAEVLSFVLLVSLGTIFSMLGSEIARLCRVFLVKQEMSRPLVIKGLFLWTFLLNLFLFRGNEASWHVLYTFQNSLYAALFDKSVLKLFKLFNE